MKRSLNLLASVAAFALVAMAGTSTAFSADMLGDEVQNTEVEFGTGWYIRGDIGGGFMETEVDTTSPVFGNGVDLGNPISLGVAGGYMLSPNTRIEVGLNQFTNLAGGGRNAIACPAGTPAGGACVASTSARVNAQSIMVNGYVDLANIGNFTPYIGAGAGFAFVGWSNLGAETLCTGALAGDCGAGAPAGTVSLGNGTFADVEEFAPAFNVMIGTGYKISENTTIDVGYRYTRFGETDFLPSSSNPGVPATRVAGEIDMHEVRVGLRYEIW